MNKKIIAVLLLATTIVSTTSVFSIASEKELTSNISIEYSTDECEGQYHQVEQQAEERITILPAVITTAGKFLGGKLLCQKHAMEKWYNSDFNGYSKHVRAVNDGKHCYNMWPQHNNIDPYKYGFKSSYLCHH